VEESLQILEQKFFALRSVYVLWSVFCICSGASAQVVQGVQVEGHRTISQREIQTWLVTRVGARLDSTLLMKDIRRILEGYKNRGFWQVEVAFPEVAVQNDRAFVIFVVTEGVRTRIDSVRVTCDRALAQADVYTALGLGPGMVLIADDLNQRLDHVLRFYENRGYPFCELRPEVNFNAEGVQVHVDVSAGPFVQIDTVKFEGNDVTKSEVLLRHLSFVSGEVYDQRRVDMYIKQIKRLPFVDDAYDMDLVLAEQALVIEITEARHTRIEGGVGVGSGAGGVGQVLTGTVAVDMLNFAGRGRQGQAQWSRQEVGVSNVRVFYREPWLLNSPVSGFMTVEVDERLGYVTHKFGGGIDISISDGGRLYGGITQNRVLPDSTGLGLYDQEETWIFEAGISIDQRDDRWNPLRGWHAEITGELGQVASGFNRQQWAADGQVFWPVGRQSTILGRARALGVSQNGGVPETAVIRLGGAQSLRGYHQEAFGGTKAGWVNVEWRWLLGPRARIFAFVDAGRIWGYGSTVWPVAYGVGLLADGRIGAVGIDYGLPRGESLGQGMVHVRMIGEF